MNASDYPDEEPLSVDEAKVLFRQLVNWHGLKWTAATPPDAYYQMGRVNEVLDAKARREALDEKVRYGALGL